MSTNETNYFVVTPDYNEALASGAKSFSASFTITPHGFAKVAGTSSKRFNSVVIDRSPSMQAKLGGGTRFSVAKRAATKFVELVDANDYICVIFFDGGAYTAFSPALATAENKKAAIAAINGAVLGDSTCLSAGINLAWTEYNKVRKTVPGLIGDTLFLTDGEDGEDGSTRSQKMNALRSAITSGELSFKVHPRGISTELKVPELRSISDATNGTPPKLVLKPEQVEEDFTATLRAAQAATLENVVLGFAIPPKSGVKIVKFQQIVPNITDLTTDEKLDADGQTHLFSTGSWDAQPREYFVKLLFPEAKEDGKRAAPARVQLRYTYAGARGVAPAEPIVLSVEWTSDTAKSSKIPAGVLRATGNVELAQAVQEGTTLLMQGRNAEATVKLGHAVKIASQTPGAEDVMATIKELVHVDNAAEGTVRIKSMSKEEMTVKAKLADAGSTVRKAPPKVRTDDAPSSAPAAPTGSTN